MKNNIYIRSIWGLLTQPLPKMEAVIISIIISNSLSSPIWLLAQAYYD